MNGVALSRRAHPFRIAGLTAAGALLAWLVLSSSLAAFLAVNAPELALWLRSADAEALLALAEQDLRAARILEKMREGKDAEAPVGLDRARALAQAALASEPLNARALRVLGQLSHEAGESERAARYMQAAARRWVHESTALAWLVQDRYAGKDYAGAIAFADTLLRTQPPAMAQLLPILGAMLETPDAAGHLERLLAGNPPWRRAFLAGVAGHVKDARAPLRLLLALRETPTPPVLADATPYVRRLLEHKLYDLAYYTWLQLLPPAQLATAGLLFNGSFERAPSGLPFDWVLQAGFGVTIDIAARPDRPDERALLIELGPGRVELRGVEQMLLLAPGSYRLTAGYRGAITGPRGLVWRIACAGAGGAPLAQSVMMLGATPAWKQIELAFTVPAADCRAQHLRLVLDARMPSEQLVSGSLWIDEVAIARLE